MGYERITTWQYVDVAIGLRIERILRIPGILLNSWLDVGRS